MSEEQPALGKPTYRELWYDVGGTLLDIWEGTTQLDAENLCGLWNHLPVPATWPSELSMNTTSFLERLIPSIKSIFQH